MLTMLRKAWFIWPMVSYDVIWAVPLQPAPAMFWLDAHILRASSSTVWACTSKRPAIARISCGSVIKRVGISFSLCQVYPVLNTLSRKLLPAGWRARQDLGGNLGGQAAHAAAGERAHQPLG